MWSFAVREVHKLHFQNENFVSGNKSEYYAVKNDVIHAADCAFLVK